MTNDKYPHVGMSDEELALFVLPPVNKKGIRYKDHTDVILQNHYYASRLLYTRRRARERKARAKCKCICTCRPSSALHKIKAKFLLDF